MKRNITCLFILLLCAAYNIMMAQTTYVKVTIIGHNLATEYNEEYQFTATRAVSFFLTAWDETDPSYDADMEAGNKGFILLSEEMEDDDKIFSVAYAPDEEGSMEIGVEYQTATSVRWGDGKQHQTAYTTPDGTIIPVDNSVINTHFEDADDFFNHSLNSGNAAGANPQEFLYLDPVKFTHDTIISIYFLYDNDIVVLSNNSADPMGYIDGWNSNHISGQNGSVYTRGETATITAHPRTAQYEFVRWSNGVTTPTLTIANIQNDTIVYAIFRENANTHTITFDPANGDEPTVVANVKDGATPTAPETPSKDPDERYTYLFDEWYMGDTRGIQPATCDTTYTAHYTGIANMYSLTLNAAAGQGTIVFVSSKDEEPEAELVTVAPEPLEFRYNTAVTLRAEAAEGYEFLAWQDDAEAPAERTVTILEDTELTATFQVKTSTAVEQVDNGKASNRKLIIDGQLIIQHGGKTFNAQGAEMH